MSVRRKQDWFPIVATDLFCGILSAVIILDAATPKQSSSVGELAFVEIRHRAFNPKDDCKDVGRVVFTFVDINERLSTLAGAPSGENIDGECVVQATLPQVVSDGAVEDPFLLIAEGPVDGKPFQVKIRSSRFAELTCDQDGVCKGS